jgi:hypothetical protein
MFKKIASAFALACSAKAADINTQFDEYLTGTKPVNFEVFEKMWSQFEMEFTSANLFKVSDAHRKNLFQQSVENIIKHNADPASTYQ